MRVERAFYFGIWKSDAALPFSFFTGGSMLGLAWCAVEAVVRKTSFRFGDFWDEDSGVVV